MRIEKNFIQFDFINLKNEKNSFSFVIAQFKASLMKANDPIVVGVIFEMVKANGAQCLG